MAYLGVFSHIFGEISRSVASAQHSIRSSKNGVLLR
ncbi:hypothetical protein YQE_01511, partial [Dendroctonus ponderosae]